MGAAVFKHNCEVIYGETSALKELMNKVDDLENIKIHPLGLVYMDFEYKDLKFRIHFYPKVDTHFKQSDEDFPAHAHDWYLNSFILKGKMVNNLFEFKSDPNGVFSKFITRRINVNGINTSYMEKTDEVGYVVQIEREVVHQGESYQMPSQVNHNVNNAKNDTLTIVHGPRDRIEDANSYFKWEN